MTLANRITFFRVFMIPVFCGLVFTYSAEREWIRWTALGVYIAAGVSDVLDGFIARRWNQHSRLGMRLDPLADKLIVNLGFVFLAANPDLYDVLPRWFMAVPVVILLRDVVIVIGSLLITTKFGPTQFIPSVIGKMTTFFQMSTIILILLKVWFAYYFIFATLVFTMLSLVDYFTWGTRLAAARKTA